MRTGKEQLENLLRVHMPKKKTLLKWEDWRHHPLNRHTKIEYNFNTW